MRLRPSAAGNDPGAAEAHGAVWGAAPGFSAAFATTGVMRNTAAVRAHSRKVRNEIRTPQQVFLRCSAISV
jgi:hypothetical protein